MALFRFGRKTADEPAAEPQPGAATPAAAPPAGEAAAAPASRSFLDRLKAGLAKTAKVLSTDVRDLFKREGRLVDEEFLEELRGALVRTDMGPAAAEAIVTDVRDRLRARVVDPEVVIDSIRRQLLARLAGAEAGIAMAASGPTVILVTGVNGSGKTTSIAKLARLFTRNGKRVVLGAGDTFRAAAVEQLTMWAGRVGAEIVRGETGCDPASVAHRAAARAVEGNFDVCIVDTAGRLQTQSNLMQELGKIRRVIAKQIPDAPHETLLVLDATAGQNALSQAKGFKEAAGCTGIVLAKLDGSARGGVIVPVAEQFGLPVKFVGVGESADDLDAFVPEQFVSALLDGMLAGGPVTASGSPVTPSGSPVTP
jgi:fused signal recognition particle receptor